MKKNKEKFTLASKIIPHTITSILYVLILFLQFCRKVYRKLFGNFFPFILNKFTKVLLL